MRLIREPIQTGQRAIVETQRVIVETQRVIVETQGVIVGTQGVIVGTMSGAPRRVASASWSPSCVCETRSASTRFS